MNASWSQLPPVASCSAPAALVPEQFPGAGVGVVVVVTFVSGSSVEVAPSTRTDTLAGVPASAGAATALRPPTASTATSAAMCLLCMSCSFVWLDFGTGRRERAGGRADGGVDRGAALRTAGGVPHAHREAIRGDRAP